jgi:hypothetical protein
LFVLQTLALLLSQYPADLAKERFLSNQQQFELYSTVAVVNCSRNMLCKLQELAKERFDATKFLSVFKRGHPEWLVELTLLHFSWSCKPQPSSSPVTLQELAKGRFLCTTF